MSDKICCNCGTIHDEDVVRVCARCGLMLCSECEYGPGSLCGNCEDEVEVQSE